MSQRKKYNSSRINLTVSIIFHTGLVLAVIFFAAREGILGNKLKQLTVTMVPREKKTEPPKEKPATKVEPPKMATAPKPAVEPPRSIAMAPPPATVAPASVAPAAVNLPEMDFHDGAHEVLTGDANAVYKGLVELALRGHWNRPDNIDDKKYEAEVELTVDQDGNVTASRWLKGSGDSRWDDSVKGALAQTEMISRPPPKGFPPTFIVRFDVEVPAGEESMQFSSR